MLVNKHSRQRQRLWDAWVGALAIRANNGYNQHQRAECAGRSERPTTFNSGNRSLSG